MKTSHLALALASVTTLLAGACGHAEEKPADAKSTGIEKPVAFRTGTASIRYVTAVARGGLNTTGAEVTGRQLFVLVDLNGDALADGDSVQIRWAPTGAKPTYWHESTINVDRKGGKPDAACTFKIKFKARATGDAPQLIVLQTASGKFVSVPTKGASLATTETEDNAVTLEMVENPKTEAAE